MSYDLHNYDEWDFNFSLLSWRQPLSPIIGFDEEDSYEKEWKGACDLHWPHTQKRTEPHWISLAAVPFPVEPQVAPQSCPNTSGHLWVTLEQETYLDIPGHLGHWKHKMRC